MNRIKIFQNTSTDCKAFEEEIQKWLTENAAKIVINTQLQTQYDYWLTITIFYSVVNKE